MRATYSVEDNKLRLYSAERLPKELYDEARAHGFKAAPMQGCFVAVGWSSSREDWLLELVEEIGDEDYSPEERAADRAERFEGYRGKRTDEALGKAANVGTVYGNQSYDRAARQARKADRAKRGALTQWSKAEYWQQRTAGVIANALFKSSPDVRRGRLLRLEKEQRQHRESGAESLKRYRAWQSVANMEGGNATYSEEEGAENTPAAKCAYYLSNVGGGWHKYKHPRAEEGDTTERSLYSLLTDRVDPITAQEAAALYLGEWMEPCKPGGNWARYDEHLERRLAYERAMLDKEGGLITALEMVPGGWLGKYQIDGVTRSPKTKRVVSVKLLTEGGKVKTFNVERLGADAYRAPTPEEAQAYADKAKRIKGAAKAAKPKAPPLLNPTVEDARRLQELINAQNKRDYPTRHSDSEPLGMTQEKYSEHSKGAYARFETKFITEKLTIYHCGFGGDNRTQRHKVFKIRTAPPREMYGARRVVVLTDAPQKSLPFEEAEALRATEPTKESILANVEALRAVCCLSWLPKDDSPEYKLLSDACYVGVCYISSQTQFGFRDAFADLQRQQQGASA